MAITMKSNTLQGSLKNAHRWTMMRAASSTTKNASIKSSSTSSNGPIASITVLLVCSPSVTALMMITAMTTRSVRGSSTMVRSLASTVSSLWRAVAYIAAGCASVVAAVRGTPCAPTESSLHCVPIR